MQKYKSNITTTSGAAVRGVHVLVIDEDGNNAALFLDRAGTVPAQNPLTTGPDGVFYFYAVNGRYSLRTTVDGVTITDDDVVLMMDPAEITVAGPIAEAMAAAQAAATAAETAVANSSIPVLVSSAQNAVVDANAALAQAIASSNSAALSKTDADAARDAAVTAKMAAEAALDSFDDRYLGAKAVAPTVDNDGAALLIGALYWDTALPGMRSWNGSAWVTLQAATAAAISNTPAGSIAATTVQSAIDELDAEKAPLSSPALTGTPTAPTAAPGTNTTQLATTEYARAAAIAFGGIKAYATHAEAAIAAALLPDGADVEVSQDEARAGARTRYKVQAGALVFVVNLDQTRLDLAAATGASLVGFGASTVADALVTTILGDGATDKSAEITAANALGHPIRIKGVAVVGSSTTITVPLVDSIEQIFSPASLVTISNGLPVRPEWFGSAAGNIRLAVNALPATGGVVQLRDATYPSSYNTMTPEKVGAGSGVPGVDYLAKPGVSIFGARLPAVAADLSAMEHGTIIKGPFYVHADGFRADLVGVDSGPSVCAALYAGVARDGLALIQPTPSTPVYTKDNVIGHVRGLCRGRDAAVHAVLLEGVDGLVICTAEGYQSNIGVVIKSINVQAGTLAGYESDGFGAYLKSDTFANCYNVSVDKIIARNAGAVTGIGLLVQAATASASNIKIGTVECGNKALGWMLQSETSFLQSCRIGTVVVDGCTNGGRAYGAQFSRIDDVTILNATNGVEVYETISNTFSIGKLSLVNISSYGLLSEGIVAVESVDASNVNALFRYGAGAKISVGSYRGDSIGTVCSFVSGSTALAGSWAPFGSGNSAFSIVPSNHRIRMSGLITVGTDAVMIAALPAALRPSANLRFTALGLAGAVYSPVEIVVGADGMVSATNYAAGNTYLAVDGIEWDAA